MEKVPHYNIVFLTPGYSVDKEYIKSFIKTVKVLEEKNITWNLSIEYASHVNNAREMTLNAGSEMDHESSIPFMGKFTYDRLMWIDSDISWEPEDIIRLYESDKEIICGAYILSHGVIAVIKEQFGMGYLYEDFIKLDKPEKVDSAGFGFIMIKNGIFEKLERPWFQSVYVEARNNKGESKAFQITGEDISWCIRVKNLGYEIWVDPLVKVTHNKTMKLAWDGIKF